MEGRMRNSVVTTLVVAGLSASLVGAQERTDSGAVGERFAYSIQYVAKDKVFKATLFKRKAESYDMISRYIQERISRVIDGRGFHVGGPKQSSVFAVTIDL